MRRLVTRRALVSAFVLLPGGLAGCAWMYSAPVPLHTESYQASPSTRASTLLVLMPGRGDKAGDWAAHGFVSDLRAAGLTFDVEQSFDEESRWILSTPCLSSALG